jgi:hypothetical protein
MRSTLQLFFKLVLCALALSGAMAQAQPAPTVLFVASERLTDLSLGYRHFPQVARLGFGSPAKPWHAWYGGSVEMRPLVYLPGHKTGQAVRPQADMLIGNRFKGQPWSSAFAALATLDSDRNGIIEGQEMRDLYVWVDFAGDGTLAAREDALRRAEVYYSGFDLRAGPKAQSGHAREGRLLSFAVMVPYASRAHLLELDVGTSYAKRYQGFLPGAHRQGGPATDTPLADSPFNGWWRWTVTNDADWKDRTRPWGPELGGQLLLAAGKDGVEGVVRTLGPNDDHINIPLEGTWRNQTAQWTSVSPLGLTHSKVRLESLHGYPILRGKSWSNRNGKVREWTWEARFDKALD